MVEVGADAGRTAVRRLDVGAGVSSVADGAQVEHRRPARRAHPVGEVLGDVERADGIGAVRRFVAQAGPGRQRRGDPPGRRRHADAPPVVLAHEQQRHRHPLVRRVDRRVQRALRGRMVQRGIAEAADGQSVLGPAGGEAETPRPADGEGDAHRAREVRCDRRGLRDHGEVGMAEHLVPPAGDRLVGRSEQAEQDVTDTVVTRHLLRPGEVEAARPVVQEGRVGRSQRGGDQGVGLVAGRTDRVEPASCRAQPAGRVVEVAAGQLGVEDGVQMLDGQRRSGRQDGLAGTPFERPDGGQQRPLQVVEIRRHCRAHGRNVTIGGWIGRREP